jgi:hypothetical protein
MPRNDGSTPRTTRAQRRRNRTRILRKAAALRGRYETRNGSTEHWLRHATRDRGRS